MSTHRFLVDSHFNGAGVDEAMDHGAVHTAAFVPAAIEARVEKADLFRGQVGKKTVEAAQVDPINTRADPVTRNQVVLFAPHTYSAPCIGPWGLKKDIIAAFFAPLVGGLDLGDVEGDFAIFPVEHPPDHADSKHIATVVVDPDKIGRKAGARFDSRSGKRAKCDQDSSK